jgi:hypothetical protein
MATIRFRRDTADRWNLVNPILLLGEPALETDTGLVKIGDGETPWRDLAYFTSSEGVDHPSTSLTNHINSSNPHPVYDDGPSLALLYANAKV